MNHRQRTVELLRAITHEIRTERITFMAGSVAYNAFVSLLPLLFLLLTLISVVGNQALEASLIAVVRATATPGAGDVLVSELRNTSVEASAFGIAVLVWGMLRIFRSLDAAFSDIYETQTENTFGDQILDGLVVFVSMAGVALVAVLVESRVGLGAESTLEWFGVRLLLVGFIALALFPMYYLFPDEPEMHPIEVVPGVLFTATALVGFESGFQIYLQYSSATAQNGILAGILVFLTWLYLSGLVILIGAAINAVCSNRSADVTIEPLFRGVPVSTPDAVPAGPAADPAGPPVDPVAAVTDLERRLSEAREVTVTVDGESIPVSVPDAVDAETNGSLLPFVDDTVDMTLRWRRDTDR